jgi:hypothetical protein
MTAKFNLISNNNGLDYKAWFEHKYQCAQLSHHIIIEIQKHMESRGLGNEIKPLLDFYFSELQKIKPPT